MASKKAAKKKSSKVVTVEEHIENAPAEVAPSVEQVSNKRAEDVTERIDLANELLTSVNGAMSSMTARGISTEKIESAFYLAFQYAFCDFLRVTQFPFEDAVADLKDMFEKEASPSSEAN